VKSGRVEGAGGDAGEEGGGVGDVRVQRGGGGGTGLLRGRGGKPVGTEDVVGVGSGGGHCLL
jgi:hypothetical protein